VRANPIKNVDQREVLVVKSTIGRIPTSQINNLVLNRWSPRSSSGDGLKKYNIVSRVLRRRWSLSILKHFCNKEVIRFNELKRALGGISSTVLSDSLLGRVENNDQNKRDPMVTVSRNGPYLITGGVGLIGDNIQWTKGSSNEHYALCRCGASNNQPFCDGMHKSLNFVDDNK
jgi:CDGSH-type Zn-finger protein